MNEKDYTNGMRQMASNVLNSISIYLPEDVKAKTQLIRERIETINVLRDLCEKYGDNDWDDDLYIPDIIEKHLQL
jgi:predicted secreted protein